MVKIHITYCLRGHEYTEKNTQWTIGNSGKPQRSCIACKRARDQARQAAMIAKINKAYVDSQQGTS